MKSIPEMVNYRNEWSSKFQNKIPSCVLIYDTCWYFCNSSKTITKKPEIIKEKADLEVTMKPLSTDIKFFVVSHGCSGCIIEFEIPFVNYDFILENLSSYQGEF